MPDPEDELDKLSNAIAVLETQRSMLGDAVVEPAISALRQKLIQLEAERDEAETNDERKLVTVVFSDLSGFTALSESLDPEEVRELVNACFDALVPVVQKYDGTIDKFIGDEIMALFGAPVAHEDDAERALRAALEMMDAIASFNQVRKTQLGLHSGINTGLVVAGAIGGQDRRDYSVMGDAVNLAARLEDASSAGEIFVGPATYRLTRHNFDFESLPPLTLKGKAAPVEAHRLIGMKAATTTGRGIKGLHSGLVGRAHEWAILRESIAALGRGEGAVLGIIGEAGLGKSRLLAEARATLPPTMRWAEGRALSYTTGMSYWLARDLLRSLLGLSTETQPHEVAATLRDSVGENAELFSHLAFLLGLPLEETDEARVKFLPGDVLRERILDAVRDYVRLRTEREPCVLVWEDMHWCDPSSRQVFAALLPLTSSSRLLLVYATRPTEEGNAWRASDAHRTLQLSPLTRGESGTLIHELLRIENLPEGMRDLILDRAEGNPFFLEELLRSLIDAGAVVMTNGRASALGEISSIRMPETVQGVLAARIDHLQPAQKQALQRAAVIGRIFQERVLAHLYEAKGQRKRPLDEMLRELRRKEFIHAREEHLSQTPVGEAVEYIFRHAITHDVVYDSVLHAHRRELHELAAKAIEALFPERLEELCATLGYHYERAGNVALAARYLGQAAERARVTFANPEAIAFYKSALAALERVPPESIDQDSVLKLSEGLGDVLTLTGEHDEARAWLERSLAALPGSGNEVARSRVYRKLGTSHSLQRHFDATSRAYEDAEAQLGVESEDRSAAWWEEKVQIQMERMHLFYWQGRVPEMREVAGRYRDAIAKRGTPIQRGKFLKLLALSLLMESRFQPSAECAELARAAADEVEHFSDLSEAAHVRFVLGMILLWRGNFLEAVEHCTLALEIAERIGDLVMQARCLTYRTTAHRRLRAQAETERDAERTVSVATRIGMPEYTAMAKANLAWVAWRKDASAEAEQLSLEALSLWHAMEEPYGFDWMALFPLMAIAFEKHDWKQALECTAGLVGENQHPLPEELMSAIQPVLAAAESREPSEAAAPLKQLLQVATELHYL